MLAVDCRLTIVDLDPSTLHRAGSFDRLRAGSFDRLRAGPSTGSRQGAKYNTDLTVHASEPGMVTPFYAVVSIGMMWGSRPNGQMSRVGNNYCAACVPVVAPDFDTAGKGDCQYCKYDGYYERFHFSTPFVFDAVGNFVSIDIRQYKRRE